MGPPSQGLQRLDFLIDIAGKYGIKIILAFITNNWCSRSFKPDKETIYSCDFCRMEYGTRLLPNLPWRDY